MMTNPANSAPPATDTVEELRAERLPRRGGRPLTIPRRNLRLAWIVALTADFLQIVAFPLFWYGAISPFDDVLDLAVAAILIRLVGWHWAFLPTVLAELVPGLDMVPCWTLALFIVTRRASATPASSA